ncbi:unnamed protein product, partial [Symbiodinium sp. CCMP2456]
HDPVQGINAVTFATSDMQASYEFYAKLGMNCTYGGPRSDFTTFGGTGGGPSGGDNRYHVNLFRSSSYAPPAHGAWNGVGRSIFYVSDVNVFYNQITAAGLNAEFAPKDADWGERYFHILDPMGNELAFAAPLKPLVV